MPKLKRKKSYEETHALDKLDPDPNLPTGWMSQSLAAMYLKCGHQLFLRYVEGHKVPPGVALVEGSSHHEWLHADNRGRIQGKDNMSTPDAIDVFEEDLNQRVKDGISWGEETKDTVMGRAKSLVPNYLNGFGAKVRPVSAERKVEILVGDVPTVSFIDLETKTAIYDYKVVARSKSLRDLMDSLQMMFYTRIAGKKKMGFISLNKKKMVVEEISAPVPRSNVWAEEVIKGAANGIRAGVFPKTDPANWWCSDKFCGFWSMCRGAKHSG